MAGAAARRPIPALVFLLALSLLSGLVWWRVLHRDDSNASSGPSSSASCSPSTGAAVALPAPAAVTVNVLNATATTGLAKTVSDGLAARGFKVGTPGNDTATAVPTQIRYGTVSAAAARLVQIYLPGATLVPNTGTDPTVVVSVGSSFKDLATADEVTAAQASKTPIKTC
ncbi:MAG: uncharacterized protein JWM76_4685 [Pseudonocardiales bacterium]|nr:uncharacterized protein [Pseudonocardiales bacterium]